MFDDGEDALVGGLGEDLLRVLQTEEEDRQGAVAERGRLDTSCRNHDRNSLASLAENL